MHSLITCFVTARGHETEIQTVTRRDEVGGMILIIIIIIIIIAIVNS